MKNKKRLEKENFCIIKYKFNALGMTGSEYEVIFHPEDEDTGVNVIPEEEAMSIIEEYQMTKILTTKNGTIWERENQPFLKEHQNFFAKKEELENQKRREQEERALALQERNKEKKLQLKLERARKLAKLRSVPSAEDDCQ